MEQEFNRKVQGRIIKKVDELSPLSIDIIIEKENSKIMIFTDFSDSKKFLM